MSTYLPISWNNIQPELLPLLLQHLQKSWYRLEKQQVEPDSLENGDVIYVERERDQTFWKAKVVDARKRNEGTVLMIRELR